MSRFPLRELFLDWETTRPRKVVEHRPVPILVVHIRFIESDSVSVDHTVIDFQPVAGQSNESLDQRRIDLRWIAEDDNVPVFRVFIGQ